MASADRGQLPPQRRPLVQRLLSTFATVEPRLLRRSARPASHALASDACPSPCHAGLRSRPARSLADRARSLVLRRSAPAAHGAPG